MEQEQSEQLEVEMSYCCQTVCDMAKVRAMVNELIEENKRLMGVINELTDNVL